MIKFRIWLAQLILGQHCACYKMGYHDLCDYRKQRVGGRSGTTV